jgi:hypothetical protein
MWLPYEQHPRKHHVDRTCCRIGLSVHGRQFPEHDIQPWKQKRNCQHTIFSHKHNHASWTVRIASNVNRERYLWCNARLGRVMPLTRGGRKMLRNMQREYGKKKGKQVFYATENKRKGRGIRRGAK